MAVSAAKELAEKLGGTFDIAVAGQGIDSVAAELAGYGAADRLPAGRCKSRQLHGPGVCTGLRHRSSASGCTVRAGRCNVARGKDCTPRVAARLKAGQASDIVAINGSAGQLTYTRPMWAGAVLGDVKVNTDITVLTVRTTAFDAAASTGSNSPVEKDGCRR